MPATLNHAVKCGESPVVTVRLPQPQHDLLTAEARARGAALATILREAVLRYLAALADTGPPG
jgi:hypothetical protein